MGPLYLPRGMDTPDLSPLQRRRRRLLFRATHRGTHEADLLVGGYVAPRIETMTETELDALELVMEFPDADLSDWLTGRRALPSDGATSGWGGLLHAMRAAIRDR